MSSARSIRAPADNIMRQVKILLATILSTIAMSSCTTRSATTAYPADTIVTASGEKLDITFYAHASLAMDFGGRRIYVDPVSSSADFASQPAADLILLTHAHFDHMDTVAIRALSRPDTHIILTQECCQTLGCGEVLHNGQSTRYEGIGIEAVAAYNTTEGRTGFHPKGRDNGYVLSMGGRRIYISGDSEPTPEMLALKDIDIAFLAVNQPYTMTVEQAVEVVEALHPQIFYPYHYGQTDTKTDMVLLSMLVDEIGDVDMRIRPME